jgi:hypothetical protein
VLEKSRLLGASIQDVEDHACGRFARSSRHDRR